MKATGPHCHQTYPLEKFVSKMILTIVLVFMNFTASLADAKTPLKLRDFNHVRIVSLETLAEMTNSSTLTVAYYYTINKQNLNVFFQEYDKSSEYLEAYNVKLIVVNCNSEEEPTGKCLEEGAVDNVFTYQNGVELLTLELETMFDVNSIMSNTLQLVLLKEVPIIQSRLERNNLEKSLAGKQNLVFANIQAVGTPGHRAFIEIAYTYQDQFKFAISTHLKNCEGLQDKDTLDPETPLGMWVLFCSETTTEKLEEMGTCKNILYRGEPSLTALATFVKELGEKNMYEGYGDDVKDLIDSSSAQPVVLAILDSTGKENAEEKAVVEELSFDMRGFAKVVSLDITDPKAKSFAEAKGFFVQTPSIAVKTQDGELSVMEKEWSLENIQYFLVSYVFPYQESSTAEHLVRASYQVTDKNMEYMVYEVETSDDEVEKPVSSLKNIAMDLEFVPELEKKNFNAAIKEMAFKIVLFYLTFDHVSVAFLRDYGHASRILANNFSDTTHLARVDCFDASDLCGAENITMYPTVRIYRRNGSFSSYKGPLGASAIVAAVSLLQVKSPVVMSSKKDVELFTQGILNFAKFTKTSFLLLAASKDSALVDSYKTLAANKSTVTALAVAYGDLAKQLAAQYTTQIPVLIAFHRSDSYKPVRKLTLAENSDIAIMSSFVEDSLLEVMPELTPDNFPQLYTKKKPFAILFVEETDEASTKNVKNVHAQLAMSDKSKDFVFCWMDVQPTTMGLKILSEYTWTANLPMVSVVYHKEAQVFNYPINESHNVETFSAWLEKVNTGAVEPSKILVETKWGPPGRHYDFLAMIDAERDVDNGFQPQISEGAEQQSKTAPAENLKEERHGSLKLDTEIREELLQLRRSRLYKSSEKKQASTLGADRTTHKHSEL